MSDRTMSISKQNILWLMPQHLSWTLPAALGIDRTRAEEWEEVEKGAGWCLTMEEKAAMIPFTSFVPEPQDLASGTTFTSRELCGFLTPDIFFLFSQDSGLLIRKSQNILSWRTPTRIIKFNS